MMSPLSVSSFPDLPRSLSSDREPPAPPSSDPAVSIKKRRRHRKALFLRTTDQPVQVRPHSTADSDLDDSPGSPIVFCRSDELQRRCSLRTNDIRRYAFPHTTNGMSTSPETASFPSTPRSTKESIASLGLSRNASRSPSPDPDVTHCAGSWVDARGFLPALPPLPDVSKVEELDATVPYYVEDDDFDSSPMKGTLEELQFVDPSPTDSQFSLSSVDSCMPPSDGTPVFKSLSITPPTARAHSFDCIRPSLPSRQQSEPISYAYVSSSMMLSSVNPHIAITPASPLPPPNPRARSRFGSRGKSKTAPPYFSSTTSLVEDIAALPDRARSPNTFTLRLKRMASQKGLFGWRTPIPPELLDTDADMMRGDTTAPPSVSDVGSSTAGHERTTSVSSYMSVFADSCHTRAPSSDSNMSIVDVNVSTDTACARASFPFSDSSAIEPAHGRTSRIEQRRNLEVTVATATLLGGDVVVERDVCDVIPRLRLLRVSPRLRL